MRELGMAPRTRSIIRLPEVSPKIVPKEEYTPRNSSEHDLVIKLAYRTVKSFKGYANEKGKQYVEIVAYLIDKKFSTCQLECLKERDKSSITFQKALQSFRPYYSHILTKPPDSPRMPQRRRMRLATSQIMPYADLFAKGDIEKTGLDKVDLDEMLGKYSYNNVEYIIKTFKVTSKNRLQFTDFLKISLPDDVEIDEERAKNYYQHRRRMNGRS